MKKEKTTKNKQVPTSTDVVDTEKSSTSKKILPVKLAERPMTPEESFKKSREIRSIKEDIAKSIEDIRVFIKELELHDDYENHTSLMILSLSQLSKNVK
jgi:hypothetical protein